MKEILIVSGKGGTGKTSITAAFASLIENAVIVDCDVDASDLHLILTPEILQTHEFISGHEAKINADDCLKCGKCYEVCRYEAIKIDANNNYMVDPIACEGCGVCTWSCKVGAIEFKDSHCGQWYVSDTRYGKMVHAKLAIAAENSGKLVAVVRQRAMEIAKNHGSDYILIDGPPGIGCPVIASMTGIDVVVVVTEPTLSAIHDMERVISLAKHFNIDVYVCINKCDINPNLVKLIEDKLNKMNIPVIGKISYDKSITKAQILGQSVIEYNDGQASRNIRNMFNKLEKLINKGENSEE